MRFPNKITMIRFLLWTAVLLWMAVIFCLSAQVAQKSSSLSGSTVRKVVEITEPGFRQLPALDQEGIVESYQHVARKTAHTLAYMALGVLCMTALLQYSLINRVRFAVALAVCVGYAGSDEVHQLFVAGRSGQLIDVCIDAGGALVGISAILLLHWLHTRNKNKKKSY